MSTRHSATQSNQGVPGWQGKHREHSDGVSRHQDRHVPASERIVLTCQAGVIAPKSKKYDEQRDDSCQSQPAQE